MMKIGMMWLDDDKQIALEEKVRRAADYYRDKYGRSPDTCLVNKAMLEKEAQVGSIQVLPASNVLPNHFWLGVNGRSTGG